MNIYVASSWRNTHQPMVVERLRNAGFAVYDFRNPEDGDYGFHWSGIDENWKSWNVKQFCDGLRHQLAADGYAKDKNALDDADAVVLVLPCGRSAHLEAGYAVGCGKPLVVYCPEKIEPELMYRMAWYVCGDIMDVVDCVNSNEKRWTRLTERLRDG